MYRLFLFLALLFFSHAAEARPGVRREDRRHQQKQYEHATDVNFDLFVADDSGDDELDCIKRLPATLLFAHQLNLIAVHAGPQEYRYAYTLPARSILTRICVLRL